jgi:hypothetical protein
LSDQSNPADPSELFYKSHPERKTTMIKSAFEYLASLCADRDSIAQKVVLPDTPWEDRVLIHTKEGQKIETLKKHVFERQHQFTDLDSFLAFLNRPDVGRTGFSEFPDGIAHTIKAGAQGLVFISETKIAASLLYGHPLTHTATLPILDTDESTALKELSQGVSQKELCKLLITDLDGKVDPALLLQSSSITIKAKDERQFEIQRCGLRSGKSENAVTITVGGEQTTFRTDWTFKIRLWECADAEYEIPVELDVDTDRVVGLIFTFYPKGLQDILRQARKDLVEKINAALPANFKAYAGQYGPV